MVRLTSASLGIMVSQMMLDLLFCRPHHGRDVARQFTRPEGRCHNLPLPFPFRTLSDENAVPEQRSQDLTFKGCLVEQFTPIQHHVTDERRVCDPGDVIAARGMRMDRLAVDRLWQG
jgi:hypothetical protein